MNWIQLSQGDGDFLTRLTFYEIFKETRNRKKIIEKLEQSQLRSIFVAVWSCDLHIISFLKMFCNAVSISSDRVTKRQITSNAKGVKGTVMQIEKALINDPLLVSKVSWKFRIATIYNFAVIFPWNLLFSQKVIYFLTISIVFSFCKQNFTVQ